MIRSSLIATKRTPLATRGMVVAEHPLGAEVGAGILQKGGNAVDAAVATAFAMPVVEPFMSSLAGGGTMLVHLAKRGETLCVDFNVEAPAAAHDGCYELTEGTSTAIFPWRLVVDDANVFGPRSVAVPGSVAGLALALERWGTMELRDVLQPAITLAEEGFVPDWYVALNTAVMSQELAAFPETAQTYLRAGHYIYRTPSMAGAISSASPTSAAAFVSSPRRVPTPSTRAPSPRPSTTRCGARAAISRGTISPATRRASFPC